MGDRDSKEYDDENDPRSVEVEDETDSESSYDETDGENDEGRRIPITNGEDTESEQNTEESNDDNEGHTTGETGLEIEDGSDDSDAKKGDPSGETGEIEDTTVAVDSDEEANKWQSRLVRKRKKIVSADSEEEARSLWTEFQSLRDKMLQEGYLNEEGIDRSLEFENIDIPGIDPQDEDSTTHGTSSTSETDALESTEDVSADDESTSRDKLDSTEYEESSTEGPSSEDDTGVNSERESPTDTETSQEEVTSVGIDGESSEDQSTEASEDTTEPSHESEESTVSDSDDSSDAESASVEQSQPERSTPEEEGQEPDQEREQDEVTEKTGAEIERLQQTVADLDSEINELEETFEEYKRRNERQHKYLKKDAVEDFADRMLNVRESLKKVIEFYDWDESQTRLFESLVREFDQQFTMKDIGKIEPERGETVDNLRHDVVERQAAPDGVGANRVLRVETVGFEVRGFDGDRYPLRQANVVATDRQ
jgi:molecular chaperone GrpE (heat shock protein)